jgi:SsrA-binding protein
MSTLGMQNSKKIIICQGRGPVLLYTDKKAMATLIENKKIRLEYEILERFEAGIELLGIEVKSLRGRNGSLLGAYAVVRGGEAFLVRAHIPPFQEKNTPPSYDPYRTRKLLLKKSEIAELAKIENKKGLTIAPVSVYSKDGRKNAKNGAPSKSKHDGMTSGKIKVEIAVVRGKKKYDKRETLKKRSTERDIAREYAL